MCQETFKQQYIVFQLTYLSIHHRIQLDLNVFYLYFRSQQEYKLICLNVKNTRKLKHEIAHAIFQHTAIMLDHRKIYQCYHRSCLQIKSKNFMSVHIMRWFHSIILFLKILKNSNKLMVSSRTMQINMLFHFVIRFSFSSLQQLFKTGFICLFVFIF